MPFGSRIEDREKDQIKGYNDLKRELKKIRDMPVKLIPVVVVALARAPKKSKMQKS